MITAHGQDRGLGVLGHRGPSPEVVLTFTAEGMLAWPDRRTTMTGWKPLVTGTRPGTGGLLAGLPRIAQAMLMGLGPTTVKTVTLGVNRENLNALANPLESGAVQVIVDKTYPFDHTATAHMLGHHARGKVAITVPDSNRSQVGAVDVTDPRAAWPKSTTALWAE